MKKILPWLILVIFATLAAVFSLTRIYRLPKSIDYSEPITSDGMKKNGMITMILVGDIMLDRGVEYMIGKYGEGDFKFPFLKISDEFKKADIVVGNLEGPISDKGEKVGSIYSFRAEPKAIEGLSFAGFNVISLANNHAFDYGKEAFEDTLKRLKEAGVNYVGAGFNEKEAYSPIIKDVNGKKIGFLSYTNLGSAYWKATENSSGISWADRGNIEKIKRDIENSKSRVDILIVSLHAGEEYLSEPTKFQVEFSKAAIDAGADVIIGHHPHIIQKSEKYKNSWIFYSLGNFIFDQSFSEETKTGQMVEILIENGEIKEIIPINIKINEFFQPEIK